MEECWDNWRGVQEGGRREKQVEQFKEGTRRKIFVRTDNQVKISKTLALAAFSSKKRAKSLDLDGFRCLCSSEVVIPIFRRPDICTD